MTITDTDLLLGLRPCADDANQNTACPDRSAYSSDANAATPWSEPTTGTFTRRITLSSSAAGYTGYYGADIFNLPSFMGDPDTSADDNEGIAISVTWDTA